MTEFDDAILNTAKKHAADELAERLMHVAALCGKLWVGDLALVGRSASVASRLAAAARMRKRRLVVVGAWKDEAEHRVFEDTLLPFRDIVDVFNVLRLDEQVVGAVVLSKRQFSFACVEGSNDYAETLSAVVTVSRAPVVAVTGTQGYTLEAAAQLLERRLAQPESYVEAYLL
jgi:hypothetical protein